MWRFQNFSISSSLGRDFSYMTHYIHLFPQNLIHFAKISHKPDYFRCFDKNCFLSTPISEDSYVAEQNERGIYVDECVGDNISNPRVPLGEAFDDSRID